MVVLGVGEQRVEVFKRGGGRERFVRLVMLWEEVGYVIVRMRMGYGGCVCMMGLGGGDEIRDLSVVSPASFCKGTRYESAVLGALVSSSGISG